MRFSRLVFIATAVAAFAGVTGYVNAQTAAPSTATQCEDPKVFDRLPRLPDGCQRERISASGGLRPGEGLARRSAESEWKRQVITKYGERFQNFDNAACRRSECVPGAISGLTRCTVTAIPCARKPVFEGSGSIAVGGLNPDEIKEIQRLLKVKADGNFGAGSVAALQRWQRSQKLVDDGVPTRDILERLRKR